MHVEVLVLVLMLVEVEVDMLVLVEVDMLVLVDVEIVVLVEVVASPIEASAIIALSKYNVMDGMAELLLLQAPKSTLFIDHADVSSDTVASSIPFK